MKDIFASLDENDDGIISRKQFEESLGYLDPMNEVKLKAASLLEVCDPNKTDCITFTRYIEVLSSVPHHLTQVKVKNSKGGEISLIQFSKLL